MDDKLKEMQSLDRSIRGRVTRAMSEGTPEEFFGALLTFSREMGQRAAIIRTGRLHTATGDEKLSLTNELDTLACRRECILNFVEKYGSSQPSPEIVAAALTGKNVDFADVCGDYLGLNTISEVQRTSSYQTPLNSWIGSLDEDMFFSAILTEAQNECKLAIDARIISFGELTEEVLIHVTRAKDLNGFAERNNYFRPMSINGQQRHHFAILGMVGAEACNPLNWSKDNG